MPAIVKVCVPSSSADYLLLRRPVSAWTDVVGLLDVVSAPASGFMAGLVRGAAPSFLRILPSIESRSFPVR